MDASGEAVMQGLAGKVAFMRAGGIGLAMAGAFGEPDPARQAALQQALTGRWSD